MHKSDIVDWLKSNSFRYQENVRADKISHIKAGGIFRTLIKPGSIQELSQLLSEFHHWGLSYKIIGNMSNVLFRDGIIETPVISLRRLKQIRFINENTVCVESGVMLPTFARTMLHKGITGFSGLVGVPGSIGGAVFMNASCYGCAISDYLIEVICLDDQGVKHRFNHEDLELSWRKSAFHEKLQNFVIVSATFKVVTSGEIEEKNQESEIRTHRKMYQENKLPNLGSTFATQDIYSDISRKNRGFGVCLLLVRLIVHILPGNHHHRFAYLARKLVLLYFGLSNTDEIGYSESTFNCVVNLGNANADHIIEFVRNTSKAINEAAPLEIEIVDDIE